MPKPYPKEFREDVVAIARRRESSFAQIAKDFGISESCVQNWVRNANIEDGAAPGKTRAELDEVRDLKKRVRLLEQENEVLRRAAAYLSQGVLRSPKWATRSSASWPRPVLLSRCRSR